MDCTIAVTRFNDDTWRENCKFRDKQSYPGCLYNTPCVIANIIPYDTNVIVLEMNNTQRKILGIGMVKNRIKPKRIRVYNDDFYNQFTYYSKLRIDRKELNDDENKLITVIEELIFYGSKHLQRGRGIQKLPDKMLVSPCILQYLGEILVCRSNFKQAKDRLIENNLSIEWINQNKGNNLVTWLYTIFKSRRDLNIL